MKLNKQQRNMAYMIMLAEWEANHSNGLCWLTLEVTGTNIYYYGDEMKKTFPELHDLIYIKRPAAHFNYKIRRQILIDCIKQTS